MSKNENLSRINKENTTLLLSNLESTINKNKELQEFEINEILENMNLTLLSNIRQIAFEVIKQDINTKNTKSIKSLSTIIINLYFSNINVFKDSSQCKSFFNSCIKSYIINIEEISEKISHFILEIKKGLANDINNNTNTSTITSEIIFNELISELKYFIKIGYLVIWLQRILLLEFNIDALMKLENIVNACLNVILNEDLSHNNNSSDSSYNNLDTNNYSFQINQVLLEFKVQKEFMSKSNSYIGNNTGLLNYIYITYSDNSLFNNISHNIIRITVPKVLFNITKIKNSFLLSSSNKPNIDNFILNTSTTVESKLTSVSSLSDRIAIYNSIQQTNKSPKFITIIGLENTGKTYLAKSICKNPVVIDLTEAVDINSLIGGYIINEFGEILWCDGLLLKLLKLGNKNEIIFRSMEKCSGELFTVIKKIIENGNIFISLNQTNVYFEDLPIIFFIFNEKLSTLKNNQTYEYLSNNTYCLPELVYNNNIDYVLEVLFSSSSSNKLFSFNLLSHFEKEKSLFSSLFKAYFKVRSEITTTSRLRKGFFFTDIIKVAQQIDRYLGYIYGNVTDLKQLNTFLSEKSLTKILFIFIYNAFFSLDDNEAITNIAVKLYNEAFSFNLNTDLFTNSIFLNDYNKLELFDFNSNSIDFHELSMKNCYSFNSITAKFIKCANMSILNKENILLVGNTGVGKTTMIQFLARLMNTKLNVINLSQSSDYADLFGGFKPVSPKVYLLKYQSKIMDLFKKMYDISKNTEFLKAMNQAYNTSSVVFVNFSIKALEKLQLTAQDSKNTAILSQINQLNLELAKLKQILSSSRNNVFAYVDGILLETLKKDEWLLLDELNLANDELLVRLKPILEGQKIYLIENNDLIAYSPGKKFRIFGSMNPEYNVGKKRLPDSIRLLFTEFFIPELENYLDIKNFISSYLQNIDHNSLNSLVSFYISLKKHQNSNSLTKANGNKTNFSLRNLSRCLLTIKQATEFFDLKSSISEAIKMNFFSQMSNESISLLLSEFGSLIINRLIINKPVLASIESNKDYYRNNNEEKEYISVLDYPIHKFKYKPAKENLDYFIHTEMFKMHLKNILRVVSLTEYAVLLEGPTSCGKTATIEYLAKLMGQKVIRVNNNNNTEIEEYLGNYISDESGNFFFQEGFLVKAVREGHWVILDEINLAPSEILEALNRLLDDNRELFVTETQEVIKAHPNFRIFAAMNPSETYAGRKELSEAFKNRFIHIYYDNIPENDLVEIIKGRVKISPTNSVKMVNVFNQLQLLRNAENVFAKKEGYITIRDLIKWGERIEIEREEIAYEGYFVIAESLKHEHEKETVKQIIEEVFKIKLNLNLYYRKYVETNLPGFFSNSKICCNNATIRIICLIHKAIIHQEPVILLGDTGTGKTLISEEFCKLMNSRLITINCHEGIDTNDFIGSLKSVSGKKEKYEFLSVLIKEVSEEIWDVIDNKRIELTKEINNNNNNNNNNKISKNNSNHINDSITKLNILQDLLLKISSNNNSSTNSNDSTNNNINTLTIKDNLIEVISYCKILGLSLPENKLISIFSILQNLEKLFDWVDGPMTEAMKLGNIILIDEINLALDSVLERMNSIFEKDRVLVLSEKHDSSGVEIITPRKEFGIIATMASFGDHGKKDISPALKSRFTEIFVYSLFDEDILKTKSSIIEEKFVSCEKVINNFIKETGRNFSSDNYLINNNSNKDSLEVINKIVSEFFTSEGIVDKELFDIIKFKIELYYNNHKNSNEMLNDKEEMCRLVYVLFTWFNFFFIEINSLSNQKMITLRDVDVLVNFIYNYNKDSNNKSYLFQLLERVFLIINGIEMIIIDGLFINESLTPEVLSKSKLHVLSFVEFILFNFFNTLFLKNLQVIRSSLANNYDENHISFINYILSLKSYKYLKANLKLVESDLSFGVSSFTLTKTPSSLLLPQKANNFTFNTPNMITNLTKVLRGIYTTKPIMIEGSPGIGKTTLIQNIAKTLNKKTTRINLSEHTDIIDLIGSEFPVEGSTFSWVDGALLKAVKEGHWLIIDEMNLASQSVLEGLNSLLDHRRTLFVPELNKSFVASNDLVVFATQNPVNQGGGRKFLPKSFLNRFIRIYLDDLTDNDYIDILRNIYINYSEDNSNISKSSLSELIRKLTLFNSEVNKYLTVECKLDSSEIGEFNLRTLMKIIDVISNKENSNSSNTYNTNKDDSLLFSLLKMFYTKRLRKKEIRRNITKLIKVFFTKEELTISQSFEYKNIINNTESYEDRNILPYYEFLPSNSLSTISSPTSLELTKLDSYPNNKYLFYLTLSLQNSFPIIISGKKSVGKKHLIRKLALSNNKTLMELSLTPSMDSNELLGNFDKVNINYHINSLISFLHSLYSKPENKNKFLELKYLEENLQQIITNKDKNHSHQLSLLKNFLNDIKSILLIEDYTTILNAIISIENNKFHFEWHDSVLIKAIENGHWIILENANLCSSAVLDRLNSLLDDDKQIFLNECGVTENRVVKPHKDFRLFLLVNPKYGEVSRAIKNRCVEIYVDEEYSIKCLEEVIEEENNQICNTNNIIQDDLELLVEANKLIIKFSFYNNNNARNNLSNKGSYVCFVEKIKIDYYNDLCDIVGSYFNDNKTINYITIFYLLISKNYNMNHHSHSFNHSNAHSNSNIKEKLISLKTLKDFCIKIKYFYSYFNNSNSNDNSNMLKSMFEAYTKFENLNINYNWTITSLINGLDKILETNLYNHEREYNFIELLKQINNKSNNVEIENIRNCLFSIEFILNNKLDFKSLEYNLSNYDANSVFNKKLLLHSLKTIILSFLNNSKNERNINLLTIISKSKEIQSQFPFITNLLQSKIDLVSNNSVSNIATQTIIKMKEQILYSIVSSKEINYLQVNIRDFIKDSIKTVIRSNNTNTNVKLENLAEVFGFANIIKTLNNSEITKFLRLNPVGFKSILSSIINNFLLKNDYSQENNSMKSNNIICNDIYESLNNNSSIRKDLFSLIELFSLSQGSIGFSNNKCFSVIVKKDENDDKSFSLVVVNSSIDNEKNSDLILNLSPEARLIVFNDSIYNIHNADINNNNNTNDLPSPASNNSISTNTRNNNNKYLISNTQTTTSPLLKYIIVNTRTKSLDIRQQLTNIHSLNGEIKKEEEEKSKKIVANNASKIIKTNRYNNNTSIQEDLENEILNSSIQPLFNTVEDFTQVRVFSQNYLNLTSYLNNTIYSNIVSDSINSSFNNNNNNKIVNSNTLMQEFNNNFFYQKRNLKSLINMSMITNVIQVSFNDNFNNQVCQINKESTFNKTLSSLVLLTKLFYMTEVTNINYKNNFTKFLINNEIVSNIINKEKKLKSTPIYLCFIKDITTLLKQNFEMIIQTSDLKDKGLVNELIEEVESIISNNTNNTNNATDGNEYAFSSQFNKLKYLLEKTWPDNNNLSIHLGKGLYNTFFKNTLQYSFEEVLSNMFLNKNSMVSELNSEIVDNYLKKIKLYSELNNSTSGNWEIISMDEIISILDNINNVKNELFTKIEIILSNDNINDLSLIIKESSALNNRLEEISKDFLVKYFNSLSSVITYPILVSLSLVLYVRVLINITKTQQKTNIRILKNDKKYSTNNNGNIHYAEVNSKINNSINNKEILEYQNTLTQRVYSLLNKKEEEQLKTDQSNNDLSTLNNVSELKIKKYTNFEQQVIQSTKTLDEQKQDVKNKEQEEQFLKEKESLFPNYEEEFTNFQNFDLIQLTKNVNINEYLDQGGKKKKNKENYKKSTVSRINENTSLEYYVLFKMLEKLALRNIEKEIDSCGVDVNAVIIPELKYENEIQLKIEELVELVEENCSNASINNNLSSGFSGNTNVNEEGFYSLIGESFENILSLIFKYFSIQAKKEDSNNTINTMQSTIKENNNNNNAINTINEEQPTKYSKLDRFDLNEYSLNKKYLTYNFYKDNNYQELKHSFIPINKVLVRISLMLEKDASFSDHPYLVHIAIICFNLLELESEETSLSKMIQGMNVLLDKLFESKKVIPSTIGNFDSEISLIMIVIRRYRKIEVSSWKSLFNNRTIGIEQDDVSDSMKYIFSLLSDINNCKEISSERVKSILDSLNMFVLSANISNFKARVNVFLVVFKILESYNKTIPNNSLTELKTSLINSYFYYTNNYLSSQESKFMKFKASIISDIEEKVTNLKQIAKWDIKSYFNFRENMNKNSSQLTRIFRLYDNFCLMGVKEFFDNNINSYVNKDYVFTQLTKEKDIKEIDDREEESVAGDKDTDNTDKHKEINKSKMEVEEKTRTDYSMDYFQEINIEILDRLVFLKRPESSIHQYKNKALIDLLKKLKEINVPRSGEECNLNTIHALVQKINISYFNDLNTNSIIVKYLSVLNENYRNSNNTGDNINNEIFSFDSVSYLNQIERLLFKILEKTNLLCNINHHNEDLNPRYISQMQGYICGFFSSNLKFYDNMQVLGNQINNLIINNIESNLSSKINKERLININEFSKSYNTSTGISNIKDLITIIEVVLNETINNINLAEIEEMYSIEAYSKLVALFNNLKRAFFNYNFIKERILVKNSTEISIEETEYLYLMLKTILTGTYSKVFYLLKNNMLSVLIDISNGLLSNINMGSVTEVREFIERLIESSTDELRNFYIEYKNYLNGNDSNLNKQESKTISQKGVYLNSSINKILEKGIVCFFIEEKKISFSNDKINSNNKDLNLPYLSKLFNNIYSSNNSSNNMLVEYSYNNQETDISSFFASLFDPDCSKDFRIERVQNFMTQFNYLLEQISNNKNRFDDNDSDIILQELTTIYVMLIKVLNSQTKLIYLINSIFFNISHNGFCIDKSQEGNQQQSQNNNKDSNQVHEGGQGMSGGNDTGCENISKEIEDEEQLLGLRDEEQNEENDNKKNNDDGKDQEDDDAFEMKQDFKEDYKTDIKDDGKEKENNQENEDDQEREKDEVNDAEENKMFDKDNEIKNDKEKDELKQENKDRTVDMTKQDMEIENDEDNEYKEGDDKQEKEENEENSNNKEKIDKKQADKPEKQDDKNKDDDEDKDKDNTVKEKSKEQDIRADKDDKFDKENEEESEVDDKENKDKEEGEEESEADDNLSSYNQEENDQEKKACYDEDQENLDNGDDLSFNKNDEDNNMDIDIDNQNIDDEENADQLDENLNEDIDNKDDYSEAFDEDKYEKISEKDENKEEDNKDTQDISKQKQAENKELGYNPNTSKSGAQGKNANEDKNKDEEHIEEDNEDDDEENEEKNKNENFEEEDDKIYEEIDLNNMMFSVFQKKPTFNNNNNMNKNKNRNDNKTKPAKMELENEDDIIENFDFIEDQENQNNEKNDNKENNEMEVEEEFNQGTAVEEDKQKKQKYAKGYEDDLNKEKEDDNNDNKMDIDDEYNSPDNNELENNQQEDNLEYDEQGDRRNKNDKNKPVNNKETKERDIKKNTNKENEKEKAEEGEKAEMEKENKDIYDDNIEEKTPSEIERENFNNYLEKIQNKNSLEERENTNKDNNNNKDKDNDNKYNEALNKIEEELLFDLELKTKTLEEIKAAEKELLIEFNSSSNASNSNELKYFNNKWNELELVSSNTINKLTENIKLALEPNKQTKLKGNFKSGKRLNLRKIISFIASNYRNDKIWLKRSLPWERNYLISIAIDDSLSMKEGNKSFFALETMIIVSAALKKSGIGKLAISRIRDNLELLHSYNDDLSKEKGAFVLSKFTFDHSSSTSHETSMLNFMKSSNALAEENSQMSNKLSEQISFIISDGIFNKDLVRPYCLEAKEKGILHVFIILDQQAGDEENNKNSSGINNISDKSILKMQSVKQITDQNTGEMDFEIKNYLNDFPFTEFVVLRKSSELPEVMNEILLKWISMKVDN